jgi:hypothetical protein
MIAGLILAAAVAAAIPASRPVAVAVARVRIIGGSSIRFGRPLAQTTRLTGKPGLVEFQ